jgi:hypothetical protein
VFLCAQPVSYPDAIAAAPASLRMSASDRRGMKEALAKQIYKLQLEQEQQKLKDTRLGS